MTAEYWVGSIHRRRTRSLVLLIGRRRAAVFYCRVGGRTIAYFVTRASTCGELSVWPEVTSRVIPESFNLGSNLRSDRVVLSTYPEGQSSSHHRIVPGNSIEITDIPSSRTGSQIPHAAG